MSNIEFRENDIEMKKGDNVVIEPAMSLYWLDDAIVMSITPTWPVEDDTDPYLEVFVVEGMTRKHELDRMVNVLWRVMDAMETYNSKHERFNIMIEVEDRDEDKTSPERDDV